MEKYHEKTVEYWKQNAEENYLTTPISVLKYITVLEEQAEQLRKHAVSSSFLADEFHEWIELYEWQFNPVSFNGVIKYRWVNETYSSQATTKELYELFLSQK